MPRELRQRTRGRARAHKSAKSRTLSQVVQPTAEPERTTWVLPQEIWDAIVDYVSGDKSSVLACSLAFRQLLPRCREHLFRSIDLGRIFPSGPNLEETAYAQIQAGRSRGVANHRHLHSYSYPVSGDFPGALASHLGAYIRKLVLPDHLSHWLPYVSHALNRVTDLTITSSVWASLTEDQRACFTRDFSALASLTLRSMPTFDMQRHVMEMFPSFSALQHLDLGEAICTNVDCYISVYSRPIGSLQLVTLAIFGEHIAWLLDAFPGIQSQTLLVRDVARSFPHNLDTLLSRLGNSLKRVGLRFDEVDDGDIDVIEDGDGRLREKWLEIITFSSNPSVRSIRLELPYVTREMIESFPPWPAVEEFQVIQTWDCWSNQMAHEMSRNLWPIRYPALRKILVGTSLDPNKISDGISAYRWLKDRSCERVSFQTAVGVCEGWINFRLDEQNWLRNEILPVAFGPQL